MPGLSGLLDIGKKSLFASQAAIEVVGNNISNANTPGYSRQSVRLEDGLYLNYAPGQLGTGVNAVEVLRHFDEFVEKQYNTKMSEQERWAQLYQNLQGVEGIFNEANSEGVSEALRQFWNDWQQLSVDPQNSSIRTALLGHASNLERALETAKADLDQLQNQIDGTIRQEVSEINKIIQGIAQVNQQITAYEETGKNNANGLRDQRASLVRELAEKIDITYVDNGLGNVTIMTKAGHTLVDGKEYFRLAFEGPQVITDLAGSYDGELKFEGSADHEYTIKIVTGGAIGTAQYKVSVDGGATWLKDDSGNDLLFTTSGYDSRITLPGGETSIHFSDPSAPGNVLASGDMFQVLPKSSLFWYENSSSKMNITPQIMPNGQDNERRLIGGSLTGLFQFRDDSVGGFGEKLDAFASSLAWEVNRIHSQGAGLQRFENTIGTYGVTNQNAALGAPESGLFFGDKLTTGNVTVHVYDKSTGALVSSEVLDFGGSNFDPDAHSLTDVRAAFEAMDGISASIVDGRLQIQADAGYDFAFGSDTCGLLAALGINTFFEGTDARTLAVNTTVYTNTSMINAGHVNGAGEMNRGDNTTAAAIAALQMKNVEVTTITSGKSTQTLGEYYSALVGRVGAETASAKFNYDYQSALASDLRARQDAVSGVNLDEEMTNLIRFQHSYTAAAKLISTADSMLQVLLGLKS
ncbi:MAG: flagellar hook-associated protein FlgK [Desulfovibrionales bacterium]|nr:flagellar hook-associated protein FlgK [Desulfovibrionales bacterium]